MSIKRIRRSDDIIERQTTPIGRKIRRLRKEKNLRVITVAEAVEVSPSTVSMWETGKNNINDKIHIEKLAKALGTTFDYLVNNKVE